MHLQGNSCCLAAAADVIALLTTMVSTAVQHTALAYQCSAAPAVTCFGAGNVTVNAVVDYAGTVAWV